MQHRYDYLFSSAMNIYKYLNIELTQLRHVIVGKEWCCTPHDNVNRLYITLDLSLIHIFPRTYLYRRNGAAEISPTGQIESFLP